MSEAKRILEAIKASGVTRVAFVDDAFDVPNIPEDQHGDLLEYLTSASAQEVRQAANISAEDWTAAVEGLNAGSSDAVFELLRQLYSVYLQTFDKKFDPMGQFEMLKGPNLQYVRPLLTLIRQAAPDVTVTTYGTQMDAVEEQDGPHVVFVDLYLDPGISPTDVPQAGQAQDAAQASIARITPLLKLSPSVILMSSHTDTEEAKGYRQKIGGSNRVYASRFGFVGKAKFTEKDGQINVDPEAGDILLDLFQTYNFGRGLHSTLEAWVKGTREAIKVLEDEIDDLDLPDLAYLVRFRLAAEGQGLPDYLEWLLGECLIDEVGRQLDKGLAVSQLDTLKPEEAQLIKGAFDGPTEKVAALYHRVRFENKRTRPREHFRLGDLYLRKRENEPDHLVAIMNPDCDLIKRPSGKKPAALAVLTLQGDLQQFNVPSTSVGDFIVIDGQPQNIKWNYRAVETLPFAGVMEKAGQDHGEEYRYLGALRPLYAQEIQANMLNHLGRVGVAVPPALAFASEVTVHYVANGSAKELKVDCKGTPAYYVPARQSGQEGRMVFRRPFVRQLLTTLSGLDRNSLSDEAKRHLAGLLSDNGRVKLSSLTAEGLELEKSAGYGVLLTAKKPKLGPQSANWCCLAVSKVEPIRAEVLENAESAEEEAANEPARAEANTAVPMPVESTNSSPEAVPAEPPPAGVAEEAQ